MRGVDSGVDVESVEKEYDELWRSEYAERKLVLAEKNDPVYLKIRAALPRGRILDAGSGIGKYLFRYRKDNPCASAIGVDASGVPHRIFGKLILKAALEKLPFKKSSFDGAYCVSALQYADADASLAELRRVLKPGAKLVLTVPCSGGVYSLWRRLSAGRKEALRGKKGESKKIWRPREFDAGELGGLLRGAGFRVLQIDGYYCGFSLFTLNRLCKFLARRLGRHYSESAFNDVSALVDSLAPRVVRKKFCYHLIAVAEAEKSEKSKKAENVEKT